MPPTPDELDAAVREVLSSPSAKDTMTARDVRTACEAKLGLPKDGLYEYREQLLQSIQRASRPEAGGQAATPTADKGAVAELVTALEAPGERLGPTRAAMLVNELCKEHQKSAVTAEAMLLMCDACAASKLASVRMLDAGMLAALLPFIAADGGRSASEASMAVRMLSAMSTHDGLSERLLKGNIAPPLMGRLAIANEETRVAIAALVHNLSDTPASRMRLLFAGALMAMSHVLLEPEASAGLKEHCVQAVASLAGLPDEELSFPQVLGRLCASRAVGTVREAVGALQLIVERQPGVEGRLATLDDVMEGLTAAAAVSDAGVAAAAAALLDRLIEPPRA